MRKFKPLARIANGFTVLAAFVAATATLHAAPQIFDVYIDDALSSSVEYAAGDEIPMVVVLDDVIDETRTTAGSTGARAPKLVLSNVLSPMISGTATAEFDYFSLGDSLLNFKYVVKPGDFSQPVKCSRYNVNGSYIYTVAPGVAGYVNSETASMLPDEFSSFPASIRTIKFNDGSFGKTNATMAAFSTYSVRIDCGGTWTSATPLEFSVSCSNPSAVSFPSTLQIAQNQQSIEFTVTATQVTATPVIFTIHPAPYGSVTAGDLHLAIGEITAGASPFVFAENNLATLTKSGAKASVPFDVSVMRGAGSSSSAEQSFFVTIDTASGASYVSVPGTFVMPANQSMAVFTVNPIAASSSPIDIRLHPAGISGTMADLILTIPTIAAADTQPIQITGTGTSVDENGVRSQIYVSLPFGSTSPTIVSLTIDDTSKVRFASGDPGAKSITFGASEIGPIAVELISLDGDASVAIRGVSSNPAYGEKVLDFNVSNLAPEIVSPKAAEGEVFTFTPGGEGIEYVVSWTATDVAADKPTLQGQVNWGDGSLSEWINMTEGFGTARHIYDQPNTYGILISVRDKDGGVSMVAGEVEVRPATTVLINEYKRVNSSAPQNSYKGMPGLGNGKIDDDLASTARLPVSLPSDWRIKYSPTARNTILLAMPQEVTISGISYDSFFYTWVGGEGAGLKNAKLMEPYAPSSALVSLYEGDSPQDRQVGGVFSREFFPEDGCGDIDGDQLPDLWELLFFPSAAAGEDGASVASCENPNREDNPDFDFLPRLAEVNPKTGALKYPIKDYTADGPAFINVYEVRGTHPGLNMRPEASPIVGSETKAKVATYQASGSLTTPIDPADPAITQTSEALVSAAELTGLGLSAVGDSNETDNGDGTYTYVVYVADETVDIHAAVPVEPLDEPRYGSFSGGSFTQDDSRDFYGTDPTNPDTDGDKLTDGWEYYFWKLASDTNTPPMGERYDPTRVIEGTPIDNAEIAEAFHPLIASKVNDGDFDGDGLSDYEEMLLGTNPVHWDTDGDTMNDGWEVMWGLDPLSAGDATQNPDGDYFAKDGDARHSEVYARYGYVPYTSWGPSYIWRDRTLAPILGQPNTPYVHGYSNYEEHYLGRWCIDMGLVAAVDPMSRDYMTQPTPSGTLRRVIAGAASSDTQNGGDATSGDEPSTNSPSSGSGNSSVVAGVTISTTPILTDGFDSDGDGMPDGWELYVCQKSFEIWPTSEDKSSAIDATIDFDQDGLSTLQECHSTELCQVYGIENVNVSRLPDESGEATALGWFNKFWPTDPWNPDTDGDGVADGAEATFIYETRGPGAYPNCEFRGHVPGGGLNPCSVDTDMDFIPDGWEFQFAGTTRNLDFAGGFTDGMDGTYFDARNAKDEADGTTERNYDFDGDGLSNYQEYWTGAVYHFHYDVWSANRGYGAYDPADFFSGTIMSWDWAVLANKLENGEMPIVPFAYIPAKVRDSAFAYASTDPRDYDSDKDGMDDYYEMFHGLNPLLDNSGRDIVDLRSIRPADEWDFRLCPWLAGDRFADPDQDGIPNFEEALTPNQAEPSPHNTDPSPLWFTDISYDNSFVNLYYNMGSMPMYWSPSGGTPEAIWPVASAMVEENRPTYVYSFEINEGFDTDNDNIGDKNEIIAKAAGRSTDPQDSDSPRARKSLYLDGNSAVRNRDGCGYGPNALRSWTVEAWIKPETPATGERQIIIERPVPWDAQEDPMPKYESVRRNFRIGLEYNGAPFAEYDNGGKEALTEKAVASNMSVLPNEWTHIAATMSGVEKRLKLYVNGELVASKSTAAIPYTGFFGTVVGESITAVDPDTGATLKSYSTVWIKAPFVIGAADENPYGAVDGGNLYYNGGTFGRTGGQPSLSSFFKGWVDEVRIWNGVRSQNAIKADITNLKRYTKADVIANREYVTSYMIEAIIGTDNFRNTEFYAQNPTYVLHNFPSRTTVSNEVYYLPDITVRPSFDEYYDAALQLYLRTGGETAAVPLPATLLAHYSFDNLPDPDYEEIAPPGFAQLNGRPELYHGVPWWLQAADTTRVYCDSKKIGYLFPQYIENTVSTLPLGHLTSTGKLRPDHSVNSKYWHRDYQGGRSLIVDGEDFYENTFPNSANPYGFTYVTGLGRGDEFHPSMTAMAIYDPVYATLHNGLLPLRNARADMHTILWDDKDGTMSGVNIDTDGDGLPDYWELAHGLDPNNADEDNNGILDCYDDFDNDGLSNYAEWKAGTNPWDADTNGNGINDYEDTTPDSARMTGERVTDGDYVDDKWEQQWEREFASPFKYDEFIDRDLDGWDNWSEQLFKYRVAITSSQIVERRGTSVQSAEVPRVEQIVTSNGGETNQSSVVNSNEMALAYELVEPLAVPIPEITLSLNYCSTGDAITKLGYWVHDPNSGAVVWSAPNGDVTLTLHVYSDRAMNGMPDAVYTRRIANNGIWPVTLTLDRRDLKFGHVRQGKNWFFAFVDLDGSQDATLGTGENPWFTWNVPGSEVNEPAGVNDRFVEGVQIGWDRNDVAITLADKAKLFGRFSWDPSLVSGQTSWKAIIRTKAGVTLFEKDFTAPRTFVHEGDIIDANALKNQNQNFGLGMAEDAVLGGDNLPNVFDCLVKGVKVASITNFYAATLPTPLLLSPINTVVYEARPEFQFRLSPEATEFQFELRRSSASGELIYAGRHVALGRWQYSSSERDLYIWKFPYCVGDKMPSGEVFSPGDDPYYWTVTACGPADKVGKKSASGVFRAAASAVSGSNGGCGVIRVNVRYPGLAAYHNGAQADIRVQAFRSASFNGLPDAQVTVTNPCVVALVGLREGNYYVRAFVDQDGNGERSNWESWGYLRNEASSENPFVPVSTYASSLDNSPVVTVTIRNADTDNDCIPDALEYILYRATVGTVPPPDDTSWFFPQSWMGHSGVGPVISSPGGTDSDGDGLNDLAELEFGTDPLNPDSDGDGVPDRLERDLGFGADNGQQALRIDGISRDSTGAATISWKWEGLPESLRPVTRDSSGELLPATLGASVKYVIEYKNSLDDDEWTTIETTAPTSLSEGATSFDSPASSRFFRVRVVTE